MKIALQMDAPASFNPAGDSTIVLMQEAQKRGYAMWWYNAEALSFEDGSLTAPAQRIYCQDGDSWYRCDKSEALNLATMDAVLIRQDPPYDMAYLTATHLLDSLPKSVQVWNKPHALRELPEKWWAQRDFARYVPPTLISRDEETIHRFITTHQDIIMKPLYGYGGKGVFHLRNGADNVDAFLEHAFLNDPIPWMFQRFLPEVSDGDRRIILINGEVHGVLGRIPAEGEIRANFRVGGTGVTAELTSKQREICDAVGAALVKEGVLFAGLDLIGDWLTEINITSPTGLRGVMDLYGTNPAEVFWDVVEKYQ